mgnify:CR=1 FL=1
MRDRTIRPHDFQRWPGAIEFRPGPDGPRTFTPPPDELDPEELRQILSTRADVQLSSLGAVRFWAHLVALALVSDLVVPEHGTDAPMPVERLAFLHELSPAFHTT